MIQEVEQLRDALMGSMLAGREVASVPVLDTGVLAFAVPIKSSEVEAAWRSAREIVPKTGLWPIASTFWSADDLPFRDKVLEQDFFSRFYFEEAPDPSDIDPRSLCNRAQRVSVSNFPDAKEAQAEEDYGLAEYIEDELDQVEDRCGQRPDASEVKSLLVDGVPIRTRYQLEHWLHEYEYARGFRSTPEESRQGWFHQDPSVLLFLPINSSWEALAYLNWYGTSDFGAENYIALGKTWEERFGAELVAHYGTMLQCLVSRPPDNFSAAFPLAREHDLAGPCTLALPGIIVRDYAEALVHWDRWFLHERP